MLQSIQQWSAENDIHNQQIIAAHTLFVQRRLAPYATHLGIAQRPLNQAMLSITPIQAAVYNLDMYGECNWQICPRELGRRTELIKTAIVRAGFSTFISTAMLSNILNYAKMEIAMRSGCLPVDYEIARFYQNKICDVRLHRSILSQCAPSVLPMYLQDLWTVFDLITEVIDDLEDISEDMLSYNGNRILLSIATVGLSATIREYQSYISALHRTIDQQLHRQKYAQKDSRTSELLGWLFSSMANASTLINCLRPVHPEDIPILLKLPASNRDVNGLLHSSHNTPHHFAHSFAKAMVKRCLA